MGNGQNIDVSKADDYVLSSEHKVVPVSGFKVLDEATGIVEAIVSVTGIEDRVKDTIEPGAYTKTLEDRIPRGCWGHDWNVPISKTVAIKELLPGDPDLPKSLRGGKPWPPNAGALMVQTQFNLETQRGREAYSDVKFFGQDQEWSIGYNVPAGGSSVDPKTGRRSIKQLILHEYSPVLHGAMPEAVTQSVKSAQAAYAALIDSTEVEEKMRPVEDERQPAKPKPGPPPKRSASGTVDASGHVHVSSGPKGGQFAPAEGGDSEQARRDVRKGRPASKPVAAPIDPMTGKPFSRHQLHVRHMAHIGEPMPGYAIVGKGSTLASLAKKHLGDEKRWPEIAKMNSIEDPKKIPVGAVLKVPVKAAPAKKDDGAMLVETTEQVLADNPVMDFDPLGDMPEGWESLTMADFVPADEGVEYVEGEYDPDDDGDTDEADEDVDIDIDIDDEGVANAAIAMLFDSIDIDAEITEVPADLAPAEKADTKPGDGNAEVLRRYWSTGKGAAKIGWGTPGDFDRCSREVSKYMTLEQAHGYCNLLHHRSVGNWPAQHAAAVRAGKKDVTGGSYPLAVAPGLAGADGQPVMVDVLAKPGTPCPACEEKTDASGHCMNPDCVRFGMAVKQTKAACAHDLDENGECDTPGCSNAAPAAAKAAMLGAVKALLHDGLITPEDLGFKAGPVEVEDEGDDETDEDETDDEGKVDITLEALSAVRFFDDAEEKGYVRKQGHGGWLWGGWAGSPDKRGRSTFSDFAALGGGLAPEGWLPGEAARISHEAAPKKTKIAKITTKKPRVVGGLQVTQPLDHRDGGRVFRDGRTYRVDNVRKGVFERWKVTHEESGQSIEVNGPGTTEQVQRRGFRRMEAFAAGITDLEARLDAGATEPNADSSTGTQRRRAAMGDQLSRARDASTHTTPSTHREALQASANLALAGQMKPRSKMTDEEISHEVDALRSRLRTEKPSPGSLRSNLVRSRIADLLTEKRKRTGKFDEAAPLPHEEFKEVEAAARERARVLVIQEAWGDVDTDPPMGEYERWESDQLAEARATIVETLNSHDAPSEFALALQAELTHIITEEQGRTVTVAAEIGPEVLEAQRFLADLD